MSDYSFLSETVHDEIEGVNNVVLTIRRICEVSISIMDADLFCKSSISNAPSAI